MRRLTQDCGRIESVKRQFRASQLILSNLSHSSHLDSIRSISSCPISCTSEREMSTSELENYDSDVQSLLQGAKPLTLTTGTEKQLKNDQVDNTVKQQGGSSRQILIESLVAETPKDAVLNRFISILEQETSTQAVPVSSTSAYVKPISPRNHISISMPKPVAELVSPTRTYFESPMQTPPLLENYPIDSTEPTDVPVQTSTNTCTCRHGNESAMVDTTSSSQDPHESQSFQPIHYRKPVVMKNHPTTNSHSPKQQEIVQKILSSRQIQNNIEYFLNEPRFLSTGYLALTDRDLRTVQSLRSFNYSNLCPFPSVRFVQTSPLPVSPTDMMTVLTSEYAFYHALTNRVAKGIVPVDEIDSTTQLLFDSGIRAERNILFSLLNMGRRVCDLEGVREATMRCARLGDFAEAYTPYEDLDPNSAPRLKTRSRSSSKSRSRSNSASSRGFSGLGEMELDEENASSWNMDIYCPDPSSVDDTMDLQSDISFRRAFEDTVTAINAGVDVLYQAAVIGGPISTVELAEQYRYISHDTLYRAGDVSVLRKDLDRVISSMILDKSSKNPFWMASNPDIASEYAVVETPEDPSTSTSAVASASTSASALDSTSAKPSRRYGKKAVAADADADVDVDVDVELTAVTPLDQDGEDFQQDSQSTAIPRDVPLTRDAASLKARTLFMHQRLANAVAKHEFPLLAPGESLYTPEKVRARMEGHIAEFEEKVHSGLFPRGVEGMNISLPCDHCGKMKPQPSSQPIDQDMELDIDLDIDELGAENRISAHDREVLKSSQKSLSRASTELSKRVKAIFSESEIDHYKPKGKKCYHGFSRAKRLGEIDEIYYRGFSDFLVRVYHPRAEDVDMTEGMTGSLHSHSHSPLHHSESSSTQSIISPEDEPFPDFVLTSDTGSGQSKVEVGAAVDLDSALSSAYRQQHLDLAFGTSGLVSSSSSTSTSERIPNPRRFFSRNKAYASNNVSLSQLNQPKTEVSPSRPWSSPDQLEYEIWDVKLSSKPRPNAILQICLYAQMLRQRMPHVLFRSGAVVLGPGDFFRFEIDTFMPYLRALQAASGSLLAHRFALFWAPNFTPYNEPALRSGNYSTYLKYLSSAFQLNTTLIRTIHIPASQKIQRETNITTSEEFVEASLRSVKDSHILLPSIEIVETQQKLQVIADKVMRKLSKLTRAEKLMLPFSVPDVMDAIHAMVNGKEGFFYPPSMDLVQDSGLVSKGNEKELKDKEMNELIELLHTMPPVQALAAVKANTNMNTSTNTLPDKPFVSSNDSLGRFLSGNVPSSPTTTPMGMMKVPTLTGLSTYSCGTIYPVALVIGKILRGYDNFIAAEKNLRAVAVQIRALEKWIERGTGPASIPKCTSMTELLERKTALQMELSQQFWSTAMMMMSPFLFLNVNDVKVDVMANPAIPTIPVAGTGTGAGAGASFKSIPPILKYFPVGHSMQMALVKHTESHPRNFSPTIAASLSDRIIAHSSLKVNYNKFDKFSQYFIQAMTQSINDNLRLSIPPVHFQTKSATKNTHGLNMLPPPSYSFKDKDTNMNDIGGNTTTSNTTTSNTSIPFSQLVEPDFGDVFFDMEGFPHYNTSSFGDSSWESPNGNGSGSGADIGTGTGSAPSTTQHLQSIAENDVNQLILGVDRKLSTSSPLNATSASAPASTNRSSAFSPLYDTETNEILKFQLGSTGLEYLFGVAYLSLEHEKDSRNSSPVPKLQFTDFWAFSRGEERQAFINFIEWIMARRKKYPTMRIYHYASYEPSVLKSLALKFQVCMEQVTTLLDENVFVDAYKVICNSITLGSNKTSLKVVERITYAEKLSNADNYPSPIQSPRATPVDENEDEDGDGDIEDRGHGHGHGHGGATATSGNTTSDGSGNHSNHQHHSSSSSSSSSSLADSVSFDDSMDAAMLELQENIEGHTQQVVRTGDVMNGMDSIVAFSNWLTEYRKKQCDGTTQQRGASGTDADADADPSVIWKTQPVLESLRHYNKLDCENLLFLVHWLWKAQYQMGPDYRYIPTSSPSSSKSTSKGKVKRIAKKKVVEAPNPVILTDSTSTTSTTVESLWSPTSNTSNTSNSTITSDFSGSSNSNLNVGGQSSLLMTMDLDDEKEKTAIIFEKYFQAISKMK